MSDKDKKAEEKDPSENLAPKNPGENQGRTGIGGARRRRSIDEIVEEAVSGRRNNQSTDSNQ